MTDNMIKALKQTAAKVLLVKEEHGLSDLTEWRLSECEGCDVFQPDSRTCGSCGCYMDIKAETASYRDPELFGQVVPTHCPLGRWGDKPLARVYNALKGHPREID